MIFVSETNQKIIEENNEIKSHLKMRLEEQIQNKHIISKYEKEIEKEKDKALIVKLIFFKFQPYN